MEIPVRQVRRGLGQLALVRAVPLRALERRLEPVLRHEPHDPFRRYPDTHAFRLQVDPLVPIAPLAVPERLLDQGQQPRVLVRSVHGLDLVVVCATRDADHAQQASGGHAEPLTGLFDEERLLAAGRVFRVCARLFSQQLQRALPDRDELRPDCWTLFIRIQAQTTVDALRNSSGVCPPSRIWRRLVFQWMM